MRQLREAAVMHLLRRAVIVAVLVALPNRGSAIAAAPARVHTVRKLRLNGVPVRRAGATVTRGGAVAHTLSVGETILDGTRVDVPAHLLVTIVSSGAKSTVTLEPGSSVTFVNTGSGELLARSGGDVTFSVVPGALSFFHVTSGAALTASVHGTVFSISGTASAVTFACARGEVNITKTGFLVVGAKPLRVSFVDIVSSTGRSRVTYHPKATWYLARFTTYADAEAFYRRQLAAARRSGGADAVAASLRNLGTTQWHAGSYAAALQTLGGALRIERALPSRDGEATILNAIGIVQDTQGNRSEALMTEERALQMFREVGDLDGEAHALRNMGVIRDEQGRETDALLLHQAAFALSSALGDRDSEAYELNDIGNVRMHQGRFAEALAYERRAFGLLSGTGDRYGEVLVTGNIGLSESDLGHYTEALPWMQHALNLDRALGDRDGEAIELTNIGGVQQGLGQYGSALVSERKALALYRAIGDRGYEGYALVTIGLLQWFQGRYDDAMRSSRGALRLGREAGEHQVELGALDDIGLIQWRQTRYRDAIETASHGLAMAKASADGDAEGQMLLVIGLAQEGEGRSAEASHTEQKAVTLLRAAGDSDSEAYALLGLGLAQSRESASSSDGLGTVRQAEAVFRRVRDPHGIADALTGEGRILERRGQYADALVAYRQALALYQKLGDIALAPQLERDAARVRAPVKQPSPTPR